MGCVLHGCMLLSGFINELGSSVGYIVSWQRYVIEKMAKGEDLQDFRIPTQWNPVKIPPIYVSKKQFQFTYKGQTLT